MITSAANMIGAMLAIRKAVISCPLPPRARSAFFDRLDEVFDLGLERVYL
jgi:hypothetical protein